MRLTRAAGLLLACALTATTTAAPAAEPTERALCIAAATEAQSLMDEHKLLVARERLRVCGRSVCPSAVVKDCVTWLKKPEANLSALVFEEPGDDAGVELVDVKVSIDGAPAKTTLDGIAVEIDPGPHTVLFEASGGATSELQVLAKSADKHMIVSAVLRRTTPHALPEPVVAPSSAIVGDAPATAVLPGRVNARARLQRPIGYVVGALGIVGLGVGAAYGVTAVKKRGELNCTGDVCDATALHDGRLAATAADVAFGVGGALVAAGLVLMAPREVPHAGGTGPNVIRSPSRAGCSRWTRPSELRWRRSRA